MPEPTPTAEGPETVNMSEAIDLSGDGGAMKTILKEGTGTEKPHDGCKVILHYTGTFLNGQKFDSSVDRNEPFSFEMGKGSVIKAYEICVGSMRKGEKAVLIAKPEYAYGAGGSMPTIPPNETLRFEMELLDWKPEDLSPKSDGAIERYIVKSTEKRKSPNEGALVNAHITGTFEGRVFDDRDVEFNLGEVPEDEIISGVQIGMKHIGKDETSRLVIKPQYAFGAEGHKDFNIPPNATVEYTVTINKFEKEIVSWKLDEAESIEQAKLFKEKGTKFLKAEKYTLAIKMYQKSNSFLSNCNNDESKQIKVAVFLNIALCHQKLDDNYEVKQACNTALELEPNNVKAIFRRGTSCVKSGETDSALADFMKILELEPQNKAAFNQITICRQIIKESREKEKKLYANMFSKFASVDNEKETKDRNDEDDVLSSCGEWNMEEEARKEADRAFQEVQENVVMI